MSRSARPAWWTQEDESLCERFHEWQAMDFGEYTEDGPQDPEAWQRWNDFIDPLWEKFTCRRCEYWISDDGINGDCRGIELQLGRTRHSDKCEQWECRGK